MGVLLDIDPLTGAVSTMEYDHATKGLTITRSENVDAVLDANAAVYNDSSEAWRGDDNDFWHVARIPLTTLFAWMHEFNEPRSPDTRIKDPFCPHEEWDKWVWLRLNSGEYRKLRTAPVRV